MRTPNSFISCLKPHRTCILMGLLVLSITTSLKAEITTSIIIRNVNVIDVITSQIKLNHRVLIENGQISAISKDSTSFKAPIGATEINGKGKYLVPGFIDMHVHLNPKMKAQAIAPTLALTDKDIASTDHLSLFLMNGVTTIQVLHGDTVMLELRDAIANDQALGPRMLVSSPRLDGNPPSDSFARIVATGPQGTSVVDEMHATGYDLIKIYDLLNQESYDAIVKRSHELGMRITGHLPRTLPIEYGLGINMSTDRQDRVAHLEDFASYAVDHSDREVKDFTELARKSGVGVTPTLIVFKNVLRSVFDLEDLLQDPAVGYTDPILYRSWLPDMNRYQSERFMDEKLRQRLVKRYDFMQRLTFAFFKAGVPMAVGSDCYVSGTVCGFSFADELEELVATGIEPSAVLKMATIGGARAIGMEDRLGSITPGKIADLVLLDENPLKNIANARKVSGIVVNGRWLSRDDLRRNLAAALTEFSKLDQRLKLEIKRPELIKN